MANMKKYKSNKFVKACRICLAMDRKMYHIKKFNLSVYYEEITGISVKGNKDGLPQKLCWECTHRLVACNRFKSKALRSHTLMTELLQAAKYLTSQNLTTIDRDSNELTTKLSQRIFESDHLDVVLEHPQSIDNLELQDIKNDIEFSETKNGIELSETKNDIELLSEIKIENDYSSSDEILSKKNYVKEVSVKIDKRKKPANEVLNQDIFNITDLSYEEQLFEIKKRRESANYKNSEYKCMECFKGFLDVGAFKSHIARHSDQSGTYQCEVCKIRFKKQHALRNHTTSHMQKFSCKQCPYITTRRHAAKLHEEYHNGTRYQCPHCQEHFVKISTYMSHVRIKHPSDFVCGLCGHSFVSAKGLGLHKKLKHRFDECTIPEDSPSCEECGVNFISRDALENHLKLSTRHNNGENQRKRVRRTRELQDIAETKKKRPPCKPEGPISCEQCDLQLPDSLSYYRHFRRSHPDKNRTNYPSMKSKSMCEVCGKMFQSLALLQDHSFTHTDSKQFKCGVCDKHFQRKYRLIAHRRLHLAHRAAHACHVCDKRFTTASNMHRHMFSHTGLKPFKCEMCGKGFKHASEKRVHITYVHLKKPWPKRAKGKRRSDSRQGQMPPQVMPQDTHELDLVQPLWPACNDPKITDSLEDKPMYYNLKI